MNSIQINNQKIPLTFRRSPRARRLSLRIKTDKPELVLTVPRWTLDIEIRNFLNKQSAWIEKHWGKAKKQSAKRPKFTYQTGDTFYYFGEPITLKVIPSSFFRPRIKVVENDLIISLHRTTKLSEGKHLIKKAVQDFYKQKASEVIYDRLQHFNEHYGFKYKRVTFRNQKTRWGSCSSAKNLNFNWRLIMAPIEVIDYVVVHEMCHLKQMNHSKKFWDLVGEMIPNYKVIKKWLRDNQYLLTI